jgi:hypothetical protein
MFVVLDTNSFHGDPMLRGRNFRLLGAEQQRGALQIVVPEAVRAELPKRFREQLTHASAGAGKALAKLAALEVKTPTLELPDIEAASQAYPLLLKARLNELGILVPSLPEISVGQLFELAIEERRPFRAGGRGFKDALIWQTVLGLAEKDGTVLISNDRDFAESENQPTVLHHHLREDLEMAGLASETVRLVKDLQIFVSEYVPSNTLILDQARQLLKTDATWADTLGEQLGKALVRFVPERGVTVVASNNAQVENVIVADSRLDAIGIDAAYESDGQRWLDVTVEATLAFEFATSPLSAEWLAEEKADIEIDAEGDSVLYGHTGERAVLISYAVDLDPDTFAPGPAEQVHAEDLHAGAT